MDFDSSSKFIASLAKFLQSLCNGYVDFDKGVEVIGHIYINVDSDTGKKVDYVLNEKVCKNDNSITFISNSFHAQPAEKPKPPPKKPPEQEKQNEESIVMDDSGQQQVPNSTNVGTIGAYRGIASRHGSQDSAYPPGSKRPRTPPMRRNLGKGGSPVAAKHGMPQSPRYHDSGGPAAKMGRTDIPQGSFNSGDDYEGANVFQSGGEEDDSYSGNFLEDQNSSEIDQKPVIDPDISIVKEEYKANQGSGSYSGSNQTSGPGRGKGQPASAYPVMLHQSPSNYSGAAAGSAAYQSDMYAGSSLEGAGDPSIGSALFTTDESTYRVKRLYPNGDKLEVVAEDGTPRFMCGQCGKMFRHTQHLSRHQWKCLHKREFICTECGRTFSRPETLREHSLLKHAHIRLA